MSRYELYGTPGCPYTAEMREWLEWRGIEFEEYNVEADTAALDRMLHLAKGQSTVPVLVKDGALAQIGWQGRGCAVLSALSAPRPGDPRE